MIIYILFGKTKIPIDLYYENRSKLTITVYPDKQVVARAPINKSQDTVFSRLRKHAPWIIRQLNYFDQFQPLPAKHRYISGETFYYLGRQYRLKVRKGEKQSIKLIGRYFWVTISDISDITKIKELIENWYTFHAMNIFLKRKELFQEKILNNNHPPDLRMQWMKNKWGSYSSRQKLIRLNPELVKAPIHCIDYVIIHELCHFIHTRHDKAYYKLLTKILPDWKYRKNRLERIIA